MASEYNLKLKADLDISDIQQKISQINQEQANINVNSSSNGGSGVDNLNIDALESAISNLSTTLSSFTRELSSLIIQIRGAKNSIGPGRVMPYVTPTTPGKAPKVPSGKTPIPKGYNSAKTGVKIARSAGVMFALDTIADSLEENGIVEDSSWKKIAGRGIRGGAQLGGSVGMFAKNPYLIGAAAIAGAGSSIWHGVQNDKSMEDIDKYRKQQQLAFSILEDSRQQNLINQMKESPYSVREKIVEDANKRLSEAEKRRADNMEKLNELDRKRRSGELYVNKDGTQMEPKEMVKIDKQLANEMESLSKAIQSDEKIIDRANDIKDIDKKYDRLASRTVDEINRGMVNNFGDVKAREFGTLAAIGGYGSQFATKDREVPQRIKKTNDLLQQIKTKMDTLDTSTTFE